MPAPDRIIAPLGPPVAMSVCDMTRIGPLFTVRSIPVRVHANGIGYEVVGLTTADTRAAAQREAARANAARSMERALRRILDLTKNADGERSATADLIADIRARACDGLAHIEDA